MLNNRNRRAFQDPDLCCMVEPPAEGPLYRLTEKMRRQSPNLISALGSDLVTADTIIREGGNVEQLLRDGLIEHAQTTLKG